MNRMPRVQLSPISKTLGVRRIGKRAIRSCSTSRISTPNQATLNWFTQLTEGRGVSQKILWPLSILKCHRSKANLSHSFKSTWQEKGLFGSVSQIESGSGASVRHTEHNAQFRQACRHASDADNSAGSSVSRLIFHCFPLAVIRFVVAVVIYSFNGMIRWARTHIVKKCLERIPSFTNPDTSASVIFPRNRSGVVASLTHCAPDRKRFAFLFPSGVPVACFVFFTPAGNYLVTKQSLNPNFCGFSAIASAFYDSFPVAAFRNMRFHFPNYFESPKLFLNNLIRHGIEHFNVLFSSGRRLQPTLAAILLLWLSNSSLIQTEGVLWP